MLRVVNYLDVDVILERRPGASFDEALSHFLKFCRLDLTPNPIRTTPETHGNVKLLPRPNVK